MVAISDDYYNEMNLKFLISEFERTKTEKQNLLHYIDKVKNSRDFIFKSQTFNQHIKRLNKKEKEIIHQIDKLC